MIDFFFGKPRTGKTYRAVNLIYNDYIKENSNPKYINIITNIGGFKFKEINQIFLDNGKASCAYKLVWKNFHSHLTKLYDMAINDKDDEELNKYADYHHINDALIVVDEASFYMKKYDNAVSWFLAYHGHFRIRLIFIAQSPKQIYSEYMEHTEIYYEAQPQSKQIRNNQLRYIHYSSIPFNKDNKFSSSSLKTSQSIYDLYKSGEVDKPKKIIYKFVAFSFLALFFIFALGYYFVFSIKNKVHLDDNNIENIDYSNDFHNDIGSVFCIRCDDKYCWNSDTKYEDIEVSLSYFKFVILKNDINLLYFEISNEIYKLKNHVKGQEKIVLASLTDYYYDIPNSVKTDYLSRLFVLKKRELKNSVNIENPFSDNPKNSDKKGIDE